MNRVNGLAALVLLLAAGCLHEGDQPRIVAASRQPQLAISRVVSGNPSRSDIVIVKPDGSVVRELPRGASLSPFGRATWSADGRRLAFVGAVRDREGGLSSEVFVVDAAGSRARKLTHTGRAFAPVWSPDGQYIVFAERDSDQFPLTVTIWSLHADGRARRRLLDEVRGRVDVPYSFSPDGEHLAFTRSTPVELGEGGRVKNTRTIHLLDLRSLEVRKLAERASDPAFSSNGRRIAYVSDRDENGELSYGDLVHTANELYVLDLDTGDAARLTHTRDLNEAAPSWSPDGALIAFQRGEVTGNAEAAQVLTVRTDGSCPRTVAFDPGLAVSYATPVWRPGRLRGNAHLRCQGTQRPRPRLVPLAGNLSLDEARRFRPLDLYWVGRRFEQFILSSISQGTSSGPGGRGPRVDLEYGGFNIQLWPACVRVPADIDLPPDKRVRIRGIEGVFFESGNQLELVTGKTTIVVFGEHRLLRRVAHALRPMKPSRRIRPGGDLPPPVPGALARKLRCR